jgi:YesN/AraC family two-component response regulator
VKALYKVLIVDDEVIIREGLRSAIDWATLDCSVIGEAEDGDEGLEMIKKQQPDIVFADIRMPGLNGLEMISKINELSQCCKVIILTGFRDFEYAQEAVRLGAFRFLLKPTNINELMKATEECITEIKKMKTESELLKHLKSKVKEQYGVNERFNEALELKSVEHSSNADYLVKKAIEYMKANYSKELTLKTVSDELFISTWYLSKILKKETGNTFTDLLNGIRIEVAKNLLKERRFKIYEIANLVGFSDIPYFTKLFKKITSVNPNEYKNKYS